MDMWLVQVLMTSQGAEPVIGQEQELSCRAACGITGGSGAVRVGMDTWFVKVLMT